MAKHLTWIILAGCLTCLWLHLALAVNFIPHVGRDVVFFTAWLMQGVINVGSIAQILARGHRAGHSWGMWCVSLQFSAINGWTRALRG